MHRNASEGQILDFQNTCTIDSACDEIRLEIQSRKCLRKSKHNLHEIHMYMYYGINGEVLNWISAWLTQRNQQVCDDGDMRGTKPVRSGEPQGTVLGPLCFLLYINNIHVGDLISPCSSIRLFADDSLLYQTVNSTEYCQQLQNNLT
jgi:hypothetical protein